MTDEDLRRIVEHGHETRGVVFKPPGRRDEGFLFAQIVRAMLGLANRRGGGAVIVGLLEAKDKTLQPLGVDADEEASWHYDLVSAAVAPYSDPSLVFDIEVRAFDGKRFVVITGQEFDPRALGGLVAHVCHGSEPFSRSTRLDEGVSEADRSKTARTWAAELFERFGWQSSDTVLEDLQSRIGGH
jgi:hypothetical protein